MHHVSYFLLKAKRVKKSGTSNISGMQQLAKVQGMFAALKSAQIYVNAAVGPVGDEIMRSVAASVTPDVQETLNKQRAKALLALSASRWVWPDEPPIATLPRSRVLLESLGKKIRAWRNTWF